jgi:2-keto-4-pentenoate hydratase/2-oxohepta-3-ene-1,7-dioic acid hydratase in catechol pathway
MWYRQACPPGVGQGLKPPIFIKSGDIIELGIEGPGEQRKAKGVVILF